MMSSPRTVTQEEYAKIRAALERKYNYAKLPEDKKAAFNEELHKAIAAPTPSGAKSG